MTYADILQESRIPKGFDNRNSNAAVSGLTLPESARELMRPMLSRVAGGESNRSRTLSGLPQKAGA
jgi:hypothetical protein